MEIKAMLIDKNIILNLLMLAVLIVLMPGCFIKDKPDGNRYNTFIQIDLADNSHSIIGKIRQIITPLINNIIEQELKISLAYKTGSLSDSKEIPAFKTPKRDQQLITIYYIDGLLFGNENRIIKALTDLEKANAISKFANNLTLSDNVKFFGDKQEEIVILINDPNNYLKALNQEIRISLGEVNNNFKKSFNKDLYNVSRSERFEYIPHIAIGRLQSNSIKAVASNKIEGQKILDVIKVRIEKEVYPEIIKLLTGVNKKLDVHSFCLYDRQHSCLKICKLK